jgi:hypothetical protein
MKSERERNNNNRPGKKNSGIPIKNEFQIPEEQDRKIVVTERDILV